MRLPRDLSGRDLVAALGKAYGYRLVHQQGSHIVLQTETPRHHRIAIPDHKTLRLGTVNGILRAVASAQGTDKEQVVARLFG
jgi:predicted RNA binding protein YcfA (HicA-like mRNA interferase family)